MDFNIRAGLPNKSGRREHGRNLGALGNRINQTEGIAPPLDGIGLLTEWDKFHDEHHYKLLPELEAVIKSIPSLKDATELSVEEIYERYPDGLTIHEFHRGILPD